MMRTMWAAVFGGLLLLGGGAQAAPVAGTYDDPVPGGLTLTPGAVTVFYSTSPFDDMALNGVPGNNNPENVAAILRAVFDLGSGAALAGCYSESDGDEGCGGLVTGPTEEDQLSGTITSTVPFQFAAIFGGQRQLLIDFGILITEFSFEGLDRGFSNVRLVTPIPGAALLFAPALGALVWMRRRKAAATA